MEVNWYYQLQARKETQTINVTNVFFDLIHDVRGYKSKLHLLWIEKKEKVSNRKGDSENDNGYNIY